MSTWRINTGGAPAGLEQEFEAPAAPWSAGYWGGPASIHFDVVAAAAAIPGAGGIGSAEAVGQPGVVPALAAAPVSSAEALGAPNIPARVDSAGIASAEALGALAAAPLVDGAGIPGSEALGAGDVGANIAEAGAISAAEAFGAPTVSDENVAHDIVDAGAIASVEAFGDATVSAEAETRAPAPQWGGGSGSVIKVVSPSSTPTASVAGAGGIASGEAFGRPLITADQRRSAARRRREEKDVREMLAA